MSDVLNRLAARNSQPTTAKLIREQLGAVATKMDAELETAMNDLVLWWQDNQPTRNTGCCKPATHGGEVVEVSHFPANSISPHDRSSCH